MTVAETESSGAKPGDGTAAGMIAWLNWTIASNELVEATAVALRTGCIKVLAVEDDLDEVDVKAVDIDTIVLRFRNKHRGTMKDQTINTYEQRFRQTVEMYKKWLDNDASWRPATRNRGGAGVARKSEKQAGVSVPSAKVETAVQAESTPSAHLIQYPFPIRPGLQGKISLPENLTVREARRIANFVASLAFEDEEPVRPPLAISSTYDVEAELVDE